MFRRVPSGALKGCSGEDRAACGPASRQGLQGEDAVLAVADERPDLVKWMLNRYIGKPCGCRVCNVANCSTSHFLECCQAEQLDSFCWAQALPLILSRAEGFD